MSSEEPDPGRRDAACWLASASFAKLVTICEDVNEVREGLLFESL